MSPQKTANSCKCFISLDIEECLLISDTLRIRLKSISSLHALQVIRESSWADQTTTLRFKPHILTSLKEIPPIQLTLPCETYGMMKRILIRLGLISYNPFTLSMMLSVGSSLKIELNGQLEKYQVISTTPSQFAESFLLYPSRDTTGISGETNLEEK